MPVVRFVPRVAPAALLATLAFAPTHGPAAPKGAPDPNPSVPATEVEVRYIDDSTMKLKVLDEKHVCKRIAVGTVPPEVIARPKTPYRAPIAQTLAGSGAPAWAAEALDRDAVQAAGVFDAVKTERLRRKLSDAGSSASESDAMSLMAVTSVQLLHRQFVAGSDGVKIPPVPVQILSAESCNAGVS